MSSRRSVCRGCGAEIVWVKTTAGKSMPCNPGAVPFWARPGAPGKVVTLPVSYTHLTLPTNSLV